MYLDRNLTINSKEKVVHGIIFKKNLRFYARITNAGTAW